MTTGSIRTSVAFLALASAASAQTPAGNEFRVNTYTTGDQSLARAAMEPDGDFVVVWRSYLQDGSSSGLFGQRFAATGAPRGAEFAINTYTTGAQVSPVVAVGSAGDFVVVWANDPQDGSAGDIRARRFDAAGAPIGGEFLVNTYTTGYPYGPQVGRAADGRFVVSWMSLSDGSLSGVAARRFDALGAPVGDEFVVNTFTTGHQNLADLSVHADGSFVAVWHDNNNRDGSGSAVFGQRFDSAGNHVGSEFQVNADTTGNQRLPAVSLSPAGGFVVAWTGPDGDAEGVFARRFDAAGSPVGNDFAVNTSPAGEQYIAAGQVAHDSTGHFVISWASPDGGMFGYGAFAQRFDGAGARRGAEFRVNTYTPNGQGDPKVVGDPAGNFLVTWSSNDQDGEFGGIYAQRFGGLAPAALGVDSAGNNVLEPGETVGVRPSWRNFNGAAQTFGGGLSNITGPAGATYAITDGAADYGTVADGASAACVECYAVSVSNPATRPAVHWDASAIESIVPDAQGQQKQWVLHVGSSFTDVPTANPFYRFIETLLHRGVTSGCSSTQYCPATATTRDQMAVFVLVAKEGTGYVPPACTTPMFADVPASNPFCRWIEELARRAVVGGCGSGNYCPTAAVTREQMAVFVLRTLDPALSPPACGAPMFADVPASSAFCRWIEELARRGVVTGCGGGNYCPNAAVTREQMGVFLSATFALTLYGP